MAESELNAWYLCAGILMGMVLCFWFCPDIEFFRCEWIVMMGILFIWAVMRCEHGESTNKEDGRSDDNGNR